ncbi:MAG: L,D-transpeptidase [candidate division Zixibacteria bacterium HGW-Zixibacteria-1]|nr:MAG: L,D-transpeptidase [candidate division Zixibacteria bacterium HGW-Zixibacteria-1]
MRPKKIILYLIIIWVVGLAASVVIVKMKSASRRMELSRLESDESGSGDKGDLKGKIKQTERQLSKLQPRRPYIVIDRYANMLYLRTKDSVLLATSCSTGSGAELIDSISGRHWEFDTPAGAFAVNSKLTDPWWRKPDWAFIEENEAIPKNEGERLDPEMLGAYALGFGDGYFIHGTIYERLLGVSVTHGCVRVGSGDLKRLYDLSPVGTPIYIY